MLTMISRLRVAIIALTAIATYGCSGSIHNKTFDDVTSKYRPGGDKPALPIITEGSPLSDFMLYALYNNPKVEAAYHDWATSLYEVTVAGSLPQPRLTLEWMFQTGVEAFIAGIMIETPWYEKLKLRAKAASAEARKKQYSMEEAILRTMLEVKTVAYETRLLDEKIRLMTENLRLISSQIELAKQSLSVNSKPAQMQKLLELQKEQDHIANDIENLKDSINPLKARWKAALGLGHKDTEPPLPKIELTRGFLLDSDEILSFALANNLRIKAVEQELKKAESLYKLAYKENYPDINLWPQVDLRTRPRVWNPEIAATIPLWRDRIAAQIGSAKAGINSAESVLASEELNLAVTLAEKSFMWREAGRSIHLIEGHHIPLTEAAINSLSGSVGAGLDTFEELLMAKRALIDLQIQLVELITLQEITYSEIHLMILSGWPEEIANIFKR